MNFVRRFLTVGVLLSLPALAFAQEATLTGTVTDTTGAVLPGVTVTATNDATGNTFTAVTDERGIYRMPVRVGTYQLTTELQGFATATRTGVPLLVGQTANVNVQMSPSTVQETVTVTAEAPLLNVTTSTLGGNVDPTQVQELPVNGRNWMALALLAPGSRTSSTNAVTPLPDRNGGEAREFQLNMDGQQVSNEIGTGNQPRYSQDAIAEFQFVSNRFDATQGRSSGVQVNAITKSGTNQFSGLVRGNFRNSRFNAENPVLRRVEPINNQQLSVAAGGPIIRDRLHYFGNVEYEREPRSSIWNTPYPFLNVELHGDRTIKLGGVRGDYQISNAVRVMGKGGWGRLWEPFGAGAANNSPAATNTTSEHNNEGIGQLTQVLSNRAVNEARVGYAFFNLANQNLTSWSNHWQKANGVNTGSPRISFTGFNITGNTNHPRHQDQTVWTFRDDFTFSYEAGGRHDLRAGGEYLKRHQIQANCRQCMGVIDARGGPLPTSAQLQAWFPDPFNADTWNLAAISPLVRTYTIGIGNFNVLLDSYKAGAWAQDDWRLSNRLTLNLGLRWDASLHGFANDVEVLPWQMAGLPDDYDNIEPRLGFAYQLNDRTVVRGGSGLYYGDTLGADFSFATGNAQISNVEFANDGRANFALDPTNGQGLPTYEQALTRFCDSPAQAANFAAWRARGFTGATPCLTRALQEFRGPAEYIHVPRTWQTSIGFQRQLGATMAVEADYVYSQGRDEKDVIDNVNLTFNPATGANYPASDRARRVDPRWGNTSMSVHTGRSSYHALQSAFTKRYSHRWQASATYTLAGLWNADSFPFSGLKPVSFTTQPDLGGEWGFSQDDQRHRFVLNGIWQVGHGFQLSGLHYFGAGNRLATTYGGDLRGFGGGSARLRPNGTIVPRNTLLGPVQNRTDLRVQQRVPLPGGMSIDGIAELFNLFNRTNYTLGITESQPANYLKPTAGQYRTMQLGFRLSF
ncbi:MAG: TonB-dependent receptor [Acidobacteria bacterium]|nr:TonB-dependent receptor [Acidobacteriota bacterium]